MENTESRTTPKSKRQKLSKEPERAATPNPSPAEDEDDAEKEIHEMMNKIREINSKHPSLLAKIWKQERRNYLFPSTLELAVLNLATERPPSSKAAAQHRPSTAKPEPPRAQLKAAIAQPKRPAPAIATPTLGKTSHVSLTTPSRGSIWPNHNRDQVARATKKYLQSLPENRAVQLSPATVGHILDENPTYIDVCVGLERMGLKLNRARFAKIIMNEIPDVDSERPINSVHLPPERQPDISRKPSAPKSVDPRSSISPRHGKPAESAPAIQYFSNGVWQPEAAPVRVPNDELMQGFDGGSQPVDYEPPEPSNIPRAQRVGPLLATQNKAEASRKTNIADLVDLTALDSDDGVPVVFQSSPSGQVEIPREVVKPPMPRPEDSLVMQRVQQQHERHIEDLGRNVVLYKPVDRRKAMRRSRYNPGTIARDVLLATGKHPEIDPLNNHLEILKSTLKHKQGQDGYKADNYLDLSSVRWDILDAGDPIESMKASAQEAARARHVPPETCLRDGSDRPDDPIPTGGSPRHQTPNAAQHQNAAVTDNTVLSVAQALSGGAQGRKCGRPVGWRRAIRRKGDDVAALGRRKESRWGWPPAAAAEKGATIGAGVPRLEVRHKTFLCGWRDCGAKLHNLDTLRRHVRMVHAASKTGDGMLECRWQGCGEKVGTVDPRTKSTSKRHQCLSFGDFVAWTNHIERSHIGPIGWRQGDGHAAGFSDGRDLKQLETCLSDWRGPQVTPRARLPPGGESITVGNAAYVAARAAAMSKRKAEAEAERHREEARKRNRKPDTDDVTMDYADDE